MPAQRAGRVHALSLREPPAQQVHCLHKGRHPLHHAEPRGLGGFLSGPSIVGSAVIVYPIKGGQPPPCCFCTQQEQRGCESRGCDGGASSSCHTTRNDALPPMKTTQHIEMNQVKISSPCPSYSSTSSSNSSGDEFPLRINYCPASPCITRIVHTLHKQALDGVEGTELELNRCVCVCV